MNIDFEYVRKILQHYSYDIVDMLDQKSARKVPSKKYRKKEEKNNKKSQSSNKKDEDITLVRNKSVSLKR